MQTEFICVMDLGFNGKIILVTGGASGIGAAIVKELLREGAQPVIIDRLDSQAPGVPEAFRELVWVKADLSQPDQCQSAWEELGSRIHRLDGLVNNAGVNDSVALQSGTYAEFLHSLHRNVIHYFLLTQWALPYLKFSGGPIVNITSKVAETGQGGTSGYAAANGARNALTREWAVELLPFGIRVNAVVVAECMTPLYESWLSTFPQPEEKLAEIQSRIPLGNRMTQPEEVAALTVFLLSSRASHITGQLVHVDGGYVHLDRAIR